MGVLLAQVLGRENLKTAYNRVLRNKGAAGVDGMKVQDLAAYLQEAFWPQVNARGINWVNIDLSLYWGLKSPSQAEESGY